MSTAIGFAFKFAKKKRTKKKRTRLATGRPLGTETFELKLHTLCFTGFYWVLLGFGLETESFKLKSHISYGDRYNRKLFDVESQQ